MLIHRATPEPAFQPDLFESAGPPEIPALPEGWLYCPGFISAAAEAALLARMAELPLQEARYKHYTARRRIASFGSAYDFALNRLRAAPPLPDSLIELAELREKAAAWVGLSPSRFASTLVTEYRPGTALGWHRDAPDFDLVVGVSLASACRMRLRPYPPVNPKKAEVRSVELAPRSAYVLRGPARWRWQHSIAPTLALRYSVTFRTRVA